MKEYEGQSKEFEQALQMVLPEVISEDPRFMEKDPPPLSEEFPVGSKVFFLGDHGYGVAAQVTEAKETTLSVMLAVSSQFDSSYTVFLLMYTLSSSLVKGQKSTNSSRSCRTDWK